jgi:hypothetical protein
MIGRTSRRQNTRHWLCRCAPSSHLMRSAFVPIKSEDQLEMQSIERPPDRGAVCWIPGDQQELLEIGSGGAKRADMAKLPPTLTLKL